MHLKIGTRSSPLALAQTDIFIDKLIKIENFSFEIIPIKTSGDKILDRPLYEIGGKALFLKELEEALISKKIDVAIHSLKDVPGKLDDEFKLACYLKREDASDCFVSKKARNINELLVNSTIGSSSPRRNVFIKQMRNDINIVPIRGNVNSRINKLLNGEVDALILAAAGLKRLGLYNDDYCYPIDTQKFIPAVGQGVICAEVLTENLQLAAILKKITDLNTENCIKIEREFLAHLNADCKTPVGAYVSFADNMYNASFMLASDDMEKILLEKFDSIKLVSNFGANVAEKMIKQIFDKLVT